MSPLSEAVTSTYNGPNPDLSFQIATKAPTLGIRNSLYSTWSPIASNCSYILSIPPLSGAVSAASASLMKESTFSTNSLPSSDMTSASSA